MSIVGSVVLVTLCICGLLLHFLMKWWDAWRKNGPIGPKAFAMKQLPGWLAAIVGAVICMLLLTSLPEMLDLPTGKGHGILKILAFCAGYMGSSIAINIARRVDKKISVEQKT